ncbi:hypothetical protein Tco_0086374 [Tanacetum coccineum]
MGKTFSNDRLHLRNPTAQDMEILIKTCLMPLALKTQNDSFAFVHELARMHANLKNVTVLAQSFLEQTVFKFQISEMLRTILCYLWKMVFHSNHDCLCIKFLNVVNARTKKLRQMTGISIASVCNLLKYICWVYYVEGLNHNLFSVGQFCDADLEIAFWKYTCVVRDLQGNDLLTDNRGTDLYPISLQETTSSVPICSYGS